ncbi:MAG: hypothetical protein ABI574_00480 [Burkholderiales bacterium]
MNNRLARSALTALITLAAAASAQAQTASAPADNAPEPIILMVPVEVSAPQMKAGCWAQFYAERNFKGDVLTLVGPAQVATLDKGTGRQLKRDIDSLLVGPKATLTVYQHQGFKDRSSKFAPNAREGGLITKLGFGGRIQSLQLDCTS